MKSSRKNPFDDEIFSALIAILCPKMQGSELVEQGYEAYLQQYGSTASRNGRIYELLIVEAIRRAGIGPVYYQARYLFVPNVEFDVLLYHPRSPVVLSCKTSLRERYKQAELEGYVLKSVYRGARVYLVTRNPGEGLGVQKKIKEGVIVGLDDCIITRDSEAFDDLLLNLGECDFQVARPIEPLLKTGFCFPKH